MSMYGLSWLDVLEATTEEERDRIAGQLQTMCREHPGYTDVSCSECLWRDYEYRRELRIYAEEKVYHGGAR